jgi:hypothetical protein
LEGGGRDIVEVPFRNKSYVNPNIFSLTCYEFQSYRNAFFFVMNQMKYSYFVRDMVVLLTYVAICMAARILKSR